MTNRLLLLAVLVAASLALPGCAEQIKVPEKSYVPTPVPCIARDQLPKKPDLRSESDLMGMDRYRRTLAAWSDLLRSWAYQRELEVLVEGCSRLN